MLLEQHLNKDDHFDHMVYIRLIEACNLRCKHCFIPPNPKNMDLEFAKNIPDVVSSFANIGDTINLRYHGGEPTLFGVDQIREVIESINKNKNYNWNHFIQTNLLNYNKDWFNLYKDYFESDVGVSWDYKIRSYKENDDDSNKKFEKIFWKNVDSAVSDGLDIYLVVTATKLFFKRYSDPFEFFQLMKDKGIRRLHFEKITKTGSARKYWDELGLNYKEYSSYMSKWYKYFMMWKEKNEDLVISPFDGLTKSVNKLKNKNNKNERVLGYGCWSGACDTRFHTIDANGYKKGCTALTSEEDNVNASNEVKIIDISNIKNARSERKEKFNCSSCKFNSICSSGCLASVDDGSGECSGGYSLFDTIFRYSDSYKV